MDVNIQNKKLELIQWLTTLEDNSVIQKIIELRKSEEQNGHNDLSEAEKKSINLGILDAKNGKLKPNAKAKEIYGKWL